MREQLQKRVASIVAVAGPRVEPPDVCRKGPRRAAGTQELHAGKYLGSKHKDQGDPEQNSRAGRPASRAAATRMVSSYARATAYEARCAIQESRFSPCRSCARLPSQEAMARRQTAT